ARGGTVGARMMGLRVVDAGGRPMTTRQALWRALLMYPSLTLLGAGGLMSLRSSGLTAHDQWSGTFVVEIVGAT
ncbi:MAG: RDD family protein, partial [Chloroflexi bacterium]|nr:RDD family protein [Chloroflexota bacterium]